MEESLIHSLDAQELASLRRRLNHWFKSQGRPLPWRMTRDPYKIWISEIMLQQTTVKAVVPYYERFIGRFPTVAELAAATEEEVLQYWEGLGYYSRGRNLRKAAIVIQREFASEFPKKLSELKSLPGIGRYTAGAIRSFAFDLPAPIVEANTLRLYCRLLNYSGDPRSRDGEKTLWSFAETLQPKREAGKLNQALMELGSQICTPASPDCESCPLTIHCQAFAAQNQEGVPLKKRRPKVTQTVEATIAIRSEDQYLVRQRQSGERWEGMWDFIRFPVESISHKQKLTKPAIQTLSAEALNKLSTDSVNINVRLELKTEIRHSVTRYRIRLICLHATIDSIPKSLPENTQWATLEQLAELPMPKTGREFANLLRDELENEE